VRTHRRRDSSSGGHLRSRRDTRGHAFDTVRDREAPGSNPGPPTKNRIQIEVFACSVWRAGGHRFSWNSVAADFEPSVLRPANRVAAARPLRADPRLSAPPPRRDVSVCTTLSLPGPA
jgi:hypothetical protein